MRSVVVVDAIGHATALVKQALAGEHPDLDVYQARDGFEAQRVVQQRIVDLIVIDDALPVVPSIDVARELRQRRPLVPIVLLIAPEDVGAYRTAVSEGVPDAIIPKPATAEKILLIAGRLLLRAAGSSGRIPPFRRHD